MNIPNFLTISRIFFVPLLVAALVQQDVKIAWRGIVITNDWLALAIFLVAAATDLLDGYLARRWRQVTTIGTLLDPIADKLLVSAALISLVQIRAIPAWMVVLIIGREFAVSGLRSIAAAEGYTIAASDLGKTKTISQVAAISAVLLSLRHAFFLTPAYWLMWAVVIFSLSLGARLLLEILAARGCQGEKPPASRIAGDGAAGEAAQAGGVASAQRVRIGGGLGVGRRSRDHLKTLRGELHGAHLAAGPQRFQLLPVESDFRSSGIAQHHARMPSQPRSCWSPPAAVLQSTVLPSAVAVTQTGANARNRQLNRSGGRRNGYGRCASHDRAALPRVAAGVGLADGNCRRLGRPPL